MWHLLTLVALLINNKLLTQLAVLDGLAVNCGWYLSLSTAAGISHCHTWHDKSFIVLDLNISRCLTLLAGTSRGCVIGTCSQTWCAAPRQRAGTQSDMTPNP